MLTRKLKHPRLVFHNLLHALDRAAGCKVPMNFRFYIRRNIDLILPDLKATQEAYPEPDLRDYLKEFSEAQGEETKADVKTKFAETLAAHEKWQQDLQTHLNETIEMTLYPCRIPDIVFDKVPDEETRERFEQTVANCLEPIAILD